MTTDKEISERNKKLVSIIAELNLGIHILNFPHKPIFVTFDYKYIINAYVKNFDFIIMQNDETIYFTQKIKSVQNIDIELLREKILYCMTMFEQKRIWTLSHKGMFVTGFNHHNKIEKTNPYPVFSYYEPIIYRDYEMAVSTSNKYELQIN